MHRAERAVSLNSQAAVIALIALALDMDGRETEAGQLLRQAAPFAQPNRRFIRLADEVLHRNGRLVAGLEAMGPAMPMAGGLVEVAPTQA